MKAVLCTLLVLSLVLCAVSCGTRYDEEDFLGKSSVQIVGEHGEFDCVSRHPDADGLYKNAACGYILRAARKGLLGTEPDTLFFMSFDENGIAVSCYEGYRPGG